MAVKPERNITSEKEPRSMAQWITTLGTAFLLTKLRTWECMTTLVYSPLPRWVHFIRDLSVYLSVNNFTLSCWLDLREKFYQKCTLGQGRHQELLDIIRIRIWS